MQTSRNRDVGLLVASVGISALGDMLGLVPLALDVQQRTGSGAAVAAFFVALFGPMVLFSGVAGLLVDRVENTRLMAVVSAAQAVIAVALAFVGPLAAVLPLVALLGTGAAVVGPAEFALIPVAAGAQRVAAANGYVETARYVGLTAGPLIGGLLAGAGLRREALLFDALTFAAVLGVALSVKARRRPGAPAQASTPGDLGRARDGIIVIARDRLLAAPLSAAIASLLFFAISMTAELFFAKGVLHAGDAGYGLLLTGWTAGMAAGASTIARRVPPAGLALGAVAAIAVQGLGLLSASLSDALALAVAGFALGGAAHGVKNVLMRTLIHERVPDGLRGRAFAAYNGARNAAELGALAAGGVLVGAIGARTALLISGAVPLAIGAVALLTITGRATSAAPIQRRPHDVPHQG